MVSTTIGFNPRLQQMFQFSSQDVLILKQLSFREKVYLKTNWFVAEQEGFITIGLPKSNFRLS